MGTEITVFQGITLAIAAVGAVLGVVNTWLGLNKARVRLKVIPKRAIPVGTADRRISACIEVINLSEFAVTVDDIGFLLRGSKSRLVLPNAFFVDGAGLPRRLEPRSSITAYFQAPTGRGPIRCAYASTQCGRQFKGNSPALKGMIEAAE